MDFSTNLSEYRLKKKFSQKQLAELREDLLSTQNAFDEEDINDYLTGAEKSKEVVLLHDKICICLKRRTKVVISSFYE